MEIKRALPKIIQTSVKNIGELEIKTEEKKFNHPILEKLRKNKERCDKLISEIENGPPVRPHQAWPRFPRSFLSYRTASEPVQRIYLTDNRSDLTPHEKNALRGVMTWDQYIEKQKKNDERVKKIRENFLDDVDNDFYMQVERNDFENKRVVDIRRDDDDTDCILALRTPERKPREPQPDFMGKFFETIKASNSPAYEPKIEEIEEEPEDDVDDAKPDQETQLSDFTIGEMDIKYLNRAKRLYRKSFSCLNTSQITSWLKEYQTLICHNQRHLISAATYKFLDFAGVTYIDLILLGVNPQYRKRGFGTRMMKKLMELGKILTWADRSAVEFYEKLDFVKFWTPTNSKNLLIFFTNSTLMGFGFTSEECKKMNLNKIQF